MTTETASAPVQYSRVQLLIILLTPLIVVMSSTALYFSGWLMPDGRSNNGVLLDPVLSVTDFGLPEIIISQDRQWQLIQFSPNCEASCVDKIASQQQMHIALGKLQPRIQRVLVTQTNASFIDYPRLAVKTLNLNAVNAQLATRIPPAVLAQDPIFVADPFGNIMLYFTNEHDYKAQMTDLKKLLKLSTIG